MNTTQQLRKKNTTTENQLLGINNPEHKSLETLKKNTIVLKERVERLSFMISEIHSILDNSTSVSRL